MSTALATMSSQLKRPSRFKAALQGALIGWLGRSISLKDGDFWSAYGGFENYSGKNVSVNSVLQLDAAWSCVRLISETGSTLPFGIYKQQADGSKVLAPEEQLYFLLHTQPNADMTAVVFWQAIFASLLLWGNSYVEINMSARGDITSLEFLYPDAVSWRRGTNGQIEWAYADPKTRTTRPIDERRMWHIPAFSVDGIFGLSPIRYGANVFGNAMAAAQASGETFKNGMKSPALVTMDQLLRKEQRDQIRAHVKEVSATGGWMVLEKGADVKQLRMNPQDAELLTTMAFSVEQICRWFGVPPFMVGHSEKSTSWGTGIEQQMIGFVTFVMRQWCVRIEQSVKKSLMTPVQRKTLSAEFTLEGLLRGDSAARATFYGQMVNNGIYTRDECRMKENLPAMGGNAGVLTVQTAMAPIDSLGQVTDSEQARAALSAWLANGEKETQP